jgi:hypothetical protein
MSNIIYDLKIVNEKIREDLKEQFPNLSFSVKKDSRKIYITLLRGNFKAFKPETFAEERGYDTVNSYHIESDPSLTDEAKNVMLMVKEITNKYNYDNSDIQSDYFDVNFYLGLSIGTSDKPYEYKASTKSPAKTKTPSGQKEETPTGDKLLHEFNGWKMYLRYVNGSEVYVIIKDKSTPPNRESWNDIKSEMYLKAGFKWNPSYQLFVKWGKMPDDTFNKNINIINDILNKYYSAKKEQTAPEQPAPPAPTPPIPQDEPKQQPKDVRLSEYLKTFKNPSDVNNKEERLEILDNLQTILDNKFDLFSSDKERFFNLDNTRAIFDEVWVGDKGLNLLDGLRIDFSNEETKRNTLIELLGRITDIGGIANGRLEIIFGVEVTVGGEVESDKMKKVANEMAKSENRPFRIEDWYVGGLLGIYTWYSFSRAISAAKNFLNDEFEASFKYADFSDRLKKEMTRKDVVLDEVDENGKQYITEARLYFRGKDDKYVYLLEQGGYTGLYSNSWEAGRKMMIAMVTKKDNLLDYVKDVDPFGTTKVGAKEYLPQLIAQAPELFPKSAVQTDREVLQAEIDGLEQFLKDFPDLSEDDTKLILSQILDLHNLLNLI